MEHRSCMRTSGRVMRRVELPLVLRSAALVLLLASTWIVVGVSLTDADSAVVSAGRTGFTVVGLLALRASARVAGSTARGTRMGLDRRAEGGTVSWVQLSVLAASGVTIYTICSTLAIAFAGPVLPTLIIALTPAVVMVAEGILARTVPPSATIIGTAIAVTGALLYVMPRLHRSVGGDVALGLMFAVLAMSATAFYGVYFARVNREYRGALAARLFPIFALGAAPLVLWAGYSVIRGATMTWSTVGLLALLGTVVYVPVYLLQHRILLTAGASYAATLGLGVPPVVGIASGVMNLAPMPAPAQAAAIAFTIAGMYLVIRGRRRPAR